MILDTLQVFLGFCGMCWVLDYIGAGVTTMFWTFKGWDFIHPFIETPVSRYTLSHRTRYEVPRGDTTTSKGMLMYMYNKLKPQNDIVHIKEEYISEEEFPKKLVLVAIETTFADSTLLYSFAYQLNLENHWMISKLETWWYLFYMRCVFFVKRGTQSETVQKISDFLSAKDEFVFGIFPEGTTRRVEKWKSGFYHIAKNTGADIGIVVIDHKAQKVYLDSVFTPTTYEESLKHIQNRLSEYPNVCHPEKCSLFS